MIRRTHPSWHAVLAQAFDALDPDYRRFLEQDRSYFPDRDNLLNAFATLPLARTRYILFGQDPYPRRESAIGYAFIDGKVEQIFTPEGLSKEVNRATSLRNFIKMLLLCEGALQDDFSKEAVARVDTSGYIRTIHQLRENFEKNGVLLLNMALVFTDKKASKAHVRAWRGFVEALLAQLEAHAVELILFGKMAQEVERLETADRFVRHPMPHPYNISFITDPTAHTLFGPMHLLRRGD